MIRLLLAFALLFAPAAHAGDDAIAAGLREALGRGAAKAVTRLERQDGYAADPQTRIPLPGKLVGFADYLALFGLGEASDALQLALNRVAEQSIAASRPFLAAAVRHLSLRQARQIKAAGSPALTEHFRRQTGPALEQVLLPQVRARITEAGLEERYQELAQSLIRFGLLDPHEGRLAEHVARRMLDGLYAFIAEEETRLRNQPAARTDAPLRATFGAD